MKTCCVSGLCMYAIMNILIKPKLVFSVKKQKNRTKQKHTPIQYTTKQPIKYTTARL